MQDSHVGYAYPSTEGMFSWGSAVPALLSSMLCCCKIERASELESDHSQLVLSSSNLYFTQSESWYCPVLAELGKDMFYD